MSGINSEFGLRYKPEIYCILGKELWFESTQDLGLNSYLYHLLCDQG